MERDVRLALIKNNTVKQVVDCTEDEAAGYAAQFDSIVDITDLLPQPQVGWFLDGNKLVTNGTSGPIKITKLAFRQRFTMTELINIELATASNPILQVLKDNLSVSKYIDLTRDDTISGVGLLQSLGLITSERATTILTAIPAEHEKYEE
jgi:hypothetical protein